MMFKGLADSVMFVAVVIGIAILLTGIVIGMMI